MKIALERHTYAPELSRAWLYHRGRLIAIIPAPGCSTIAQVRTLHFARPLEPARFVTISYRRPDPWQGYNRDYSGLVPMGAAGLAQVLEFKRSHHDSGGLLLDGRTMPATVASVAIKPANYCKGRGLPGSQGGADSRTIERARDRHNWSIGAAIAARAA